MKKTLTEEQARIFEIMSQVDKSFVPSEKEEEKDVEEQVEEGNAFGNAVKKAKEEGEDTFEFGGETHNVQEAEISELGPKATEPPTEEDLKDDVQFFVLFKMKQEGLTSNEIKQMIMNWIDEEIGEGEPRLGNSMETDEYHTGYGKNMTQGFKV